MEVNSCTISGFVATEPIYETLKSGMAKLRFRLGTPRISKDRGQENYESQFFNVTLLGDRAARWSEYGLKKGSTVFVTGKLEVRTYQKQDGSTGISSDILANDIGYMPTSKRPNSGSDGTTNGNGGQQGGGTGESGAPSQNPGSSAAPGVPIVPGIPTTVLPGVSAGPAIGNGVSPAQPTLPQQSGTGMVPPQPMVNPSIPENYDPFTAE